MTNTPDPRQAYEEAFRAFAPEAPGADLPWLRDMRVAAISRFRELGFPSLKDEAWKYTSVAAIAQTSFRPASEVRDGVTAEVLERIAFRGFRGSQLVFVNGCYAPHLSSIERLPEGVQIRNLSEALAEDSEQVRPHLGRAAPFQDEAFTALNTAFWSDGAFLFVPEGVLVENPVHLLYISARHEQPAIAHPRNVLVVGAKAQATVVESYAGLGDGAYFTNPVTEAFVGENARLDHYKLQREGEQAFHVGGFQLRQERASRAADHSVSLGGALVRNNVGARFDGEGGDLALNGLYLAGRRQHMDNHTRIDHAKPNCTSRELYKGVLDGNARGVFYGNIVVHPDAQKTSAVQTNRNLLLSKDALVDSIPSLQILANDVKCRHGSSIGHLEDDALFYLRSRGLDEDAARSWLTYAFAAEVVNEIRVLPLRAALGAWILSRLPAIEFIKEAL